ncbi:MAG: glycosyltransferase [Planctomycetes bacterium]|nr:glycosyltransferase [Planctomycetota bacterium]
MTRRPAISVLLPVRDGGPYLAPAVADLLAQRDVDLEVVAVDDGSRDGSGEWLEARARDEARLCVVRTAGGGAAAALDRALARARHPLVAQMEADDRCPPQRLARLAEALLAEPSWSGVVSDAAVFGFESAGMRRYVKWQNGLVTPQAMAAARFLEIPALHQSGLYHAAVLRELGGYAGDPRWPLDIDFWMRWHARGLRAGRLPERLYCWRQHARQSTRTSPLHRPDALRRCKAHYFARGPGAGGAVDLLGVGATLAAWQASLAEAGQRDLAAHEWRPGAPLPPRRAGALRLFLFGTAPARARVGAQRDALDPARDWFAA